MPVTDYGRSKLAAEVLVRAMPLGLDDRPATRGVREWDRGTSKSSSWPSRRGAGIR